MRYIFLALFLLAIILMLFNDDNQVIKFKKSYYKVKKYQTRKKVQYMQHDLNDELKRAGFPFDLYKYQTIRYTALAVLIIFNVLYILQQKQISNILIVTMVAIHLITVPKTHVLKFKTPLKRIIDLYTQQRNEIYNREMGLFIIQLHNNFNLYQNNPPSAIHMINEALVGIEKIEPIFKQYLRYLQINKIDEGIKYFIKAIDTEEAIRLTLILSKLDELKPTELKDQLRFQQDNFQEKRKIKKKNKIKSQNYRVTALASATLLIILLNLVQTVISVSNATDFFSF